MKQTNLTVHATATIIGEDGGTLENPKDPQIGLNLFQDADGVYRWYQADGTDTEVSGSTVESAIEAGRSAWIDWYFEVTS